MKIIVMKKRGNIAGLAKHLSKKYGGDPHFFTKCMGAEEVAGYDDAVKKSLCAKAHKLAVGIWPGEHGGKNPTGPEKKERRLLGRVRRRCCAGR